MCRLRQAVVILGWLAAAAPAGAATRLVSTGGTDWANNCISTPCATVGRAVFVANANDTIIVGSGEFLEISTIDITKPLTINGAGPQSTAVIVTSADRVFEIASNAKVFIGGIAIRGGQVSDLGGGILNRGDLTLSNVQVRNNSAGYGGGIANQSSTQGNATLNLTQVILADNVATGSGGGLFNDTGATVSLADSYILGNVADFGAGAGIYNHGKLKAERVVVEGNTSAQSGGGLHITGSGNVELINTTLTGNSTPFAGGGVYAAGFIQMTHVTIANNIAGNGAGGIAVGNPAGYASLRNTIVAYNTGPQCKRFLTEDSGVKVEIGGVGSIVTDTSCNLWPGYNQVADPLLGPLVNNGGILPTYALPATSPAIDAGNKWFCVTLDQRSFPRPIDGDGDGVAACDVGAFEYGSAASSGGPQPYIQKGQQRGPWFPNGPGRTIRRSPDGL